MSDKAPFVFLPELNPKESIPSPGTSGPDWSKHHIGITVLEGYAKALMVMATKPKAERLKSLPSPWARMLIFEQALYLKDHPVNDQITAEWRGILALLALSERLGVEMEFLSVDLPAKDDHLATTSMRLLARMIPLEGEWDAWKRMVLIKVGGVVVGATSPRTLLFTTIRDLDVVGIPFLESGRFVDPTEYFKKVRDASTLAHLHAWVVQLHSTFSVNNIGVATSLRGFMGQRPKPSNDYRSTLLNDQLELWQKSLAAARESLDARPTETDSSGKPVGIGNKFARGSAPQQVFDSFRSIGSDSLPTDLQVQDHTVICVPGTSGVIVDGVTEYSGPVSVGSHYVNARDGKIDQNVTTAQITRGKKAFDGGAHWLDHLVEVNHGNDACAYLLTADGRQFLHPFGKDILKHLDAEDLGRWTSARKDVATGAIEVVVTVPVQNNLCVRYSHSYPRARVFDGPTNNLTTPEMAAWPDFQAPDWSRYLYVTKWLALHNYLTVEPCQLAPGLRTWSQDGGHWWASEVPILAWVAEVKDLNVRALLLLKRSPRQVAGPPLINWLVTIDFGSTHLRAFYNDITKTGDDIDPKPLGINCARTISIFGRNPSFDLSFFPWSGGPKEEVWLEPPSLVYMPQGRAENSTTPWLPSDGLLFMTKAIDLPVKERLTSKLKWHRMNTEDSRAFANALTQFTLALMAEARVNGAVISKLQTAVPSVLPKALRNRHKIAWNAVKDRLKIELADPRTESDALASYLKFGRKEKVYKNLVAVDIGGSTADFTLWIEGVERITDSIRFGGGIVSQLLDLSPDVRNDVAIALSTGLEIKSPIPWRDAGNNGVVFTHILRFREQAGKSDEGEDVATVLGSDENGAGYLVLAHLAFLFASLSYLMGLFAKKAGAKHKRFELHFAGRGALFLKWLDGLVGGDASRSIPRDFFALGLNGPVGTLNVKDVEVKGPSEPKEEVGRGLHYGSVGEPLASGGIRSTTILESGYSTTEGLLAWDGALTPQVLANLSPISSEFDPRSLPHLVNFINLFASNSATHQSAIRLGVKLESLDAKYMDLLIEKIFGVGGLVPSAKGNPDVAENPIEPLLVTELKTLLERGTGQRGFFEA